MKIINLIRKLLAFPILCLISLLAILAYIIGGDCIKQHLTNVFKD